MEDICEERRFNLSGLHYPEAVGHALFRIIKALEAAEDKFPWWPKDYIHGAGIVEEEAGELMKATLQYTYDIPPPPRALAQAEKEALHTAVTAIRFLIHMSSRLPHPLSTEKIFPPIKRR